MLKLLPAVRYSRAEIGCILERGVSRTSLYRNAFQGENHARDVDDDCCRGAFVGTGPALGQVDENDNREGFYLGLGLGDFSSSVDSLEDFDELDFDSDDTAMKAFGGWRLNRFVAIQLDYIDFG